MKIIECFTFVAALLALTGCGSTSSQTDGASSAAPAQGQVKIYSLEDVSHELEQAGVKLDGEEVAAHAFFKEHPAYHVCKDIDGAATVAVMRNRRLDPKADDQYIVIGYRSGKISELDIGPPQFSAANVASYCP